MIPAVRTLIRPVPMMIPAHADVDSAYADDDSDRMDDDPAHADVIREVEGFVHREEIEIGSGADDPSIGIG